MKKFIEFLDEANFRHLQQEATRVRILKVHALWEEQIERIENFHAV